MVIWLPQILKNLDFIKIEANEKINDIIFLQNYEFMKREEHIMMTGRAIPFVKFG